MAGLQHQRQEAAPEVAQLLPLFRAQLGRRRLLQTSENQLALVAGSTVARLLVGWALTPGKVTVHCGPLVRPAALLASANSCKEKDVWYPKAEQLAMGVTVAINRLAWTNAMVRMLFMPFLSQMGSTTVAAPPAVDTKKGACGLACTVSAAGCLSPSARSWNKLLHMCRRRLVLFRNFSGAGKEWEPYRREAPIANVLILASCCTLLIWPASSRLNSFVRDTCRTCSCSSRVSRTGPCEMPDLETCLQR